MKLDVYISNSLRRVITVGPNGVPPTDGDWLLIDTHYHPAVLPHVDVEGWEGNHVLYHHIREVLNRRGHTNMSLWPVTHVGDGMPNLPTPPEVLPEGVFSFTNTDFLSSFESPVITPPVGATSVVLGIVANLAVPGGGRYTYASDSARVKVSFGDVELTRVDLRNNDTGHCIMFYRGDNLPATGKVKVEIGGTGEQILIGPLMAQASFVPDTFTFRTTGGANGMVNRAMRGVVSGNPAIQLWAAAVRPRWNTGPITPGTTDTSMMDYTVEQSALIKGGTLWKPAEPVMMLDDGRVGGGIAYDAETGVFTVSRATLSDHPTVGVVIKRSGYSDVPDLNGHYYIEVIDAVPADFTLQEEGTDNFSMTVAYYKSHASGERQGNNRDTGRVRRVITEADPTHLNHIEPSDASVYPDRDAIIMYVRGLQMGRHIKFRIKQNGMAMRAAMGKTKLPFHSGRHVNVSVADWRILEDDAKNKGMLMYGGTTIPDTTLPV